MAGTITVSPDVVALMQTYSIQCDNLQPSHGKLYINIDKKQSNGQWGNMIKKIISLRTQDWNPDGTTKYPSLYTTPIRVTFANGYAFVSLPTVDWFTKLGKGYIGYYRFAATYSDGFIIGTDFLQIVESLPQSSVITINNQTPLQVPTAANTDSTTNSDTTSVNVGTDTSGQVSTSGVPTETIDTSLQGYLGAVTPYQPPQPQPYTGNPVSTNMNTDVQYTPDASGSTSQSLQLPISGGFGLAVLAGLVLYAWGRK